ncbi:hypothetical protein PR048_021703 [Dryococelus australis]|uniref:Uncharacterized protein n=1 Tax=Dryococelus australis TaxID=614101 RepID=A0ABQ9GYX5_9NEOP|nr:hypothetical protein PR048_021703 [Dryococelus australis]
MFNLKRKPLKKDTCNTCDRFLAQKLNLQGKQLDELSKNQNSHLLKAQLARDLMNENLKRAQENLALEVLTFDMEKTLPLLVSQQTLSSTRGNSGFTIVEYTEVPLVGDIAMFGLRVKLEENRNIKMTLMTKAIMQSHPSIEKILVAGNSFLPNDTEFLNIECALKHHQRLYTVEYYINAQENNLEKKYASRRMLSEADIFVTKLVPLWPEGKSISSAKKAEIDSMMHLIPAVAKVFYVRLIGDNANEDDIHGFNGKFDFDIEIK